jgi:predicted permease
MKVLEHLYLVLLLSFLTVTSILYKLFTMRLTNPFKRWRQGHVYCAIFLFVATIGFAGLANVLFIH